MEEILKNIVKVEYAEVCALVEHLNYEDAFKKLDGFNLTADPITMKGVWIGNNEFFDFQYKHIQGTIFKKKNGKCEVWEECNLHVHYDYVEC